MKAVFWFLVAISIVYGFYAGAVAIWQYYEVNGIVEGAVAERAKMDPFDRAARVRDDILKRAPESGVMLDESEVLVTAESRALRVLIRWSHPVIVYKGEVVLSIPISFDKAYPVAGGR